MFLYAVQHLASESSVCNVDSTIYFMLFHVFGEEINGFSLEEFLML